MNLKKYIKQKPNKIKKLVQAKIEEDLFNSVKAKLEKEKITAQQLVEAAFKAYLNE